MVAEGPDLHHAVSVSQVLGRDCTPALELLDAAVESEAPWSTTKWLVADLVKADSIATTVALIDVLDSRAAELGVPRPQSNTTLQVLRAVAVPALDSSTPSVGFTSQAGVVHLQRNDADLIATSSADWTSRLASATRRHTRHGVPTIPRGSWIADEVRDWKVSTTIAAVDDGNHRVIVGYDTGHPAYVYLASSDGVHWMRGSAPPDTWLVNSSQDPRTGAVDVLVRDLSGDLFLHHIAAGSPPVIKVRRWASKTSSNVELSCRDGDAVWSTDDRWWREWKPQLGLLAPTHDGLIAHGLRGGGFRSIDCRGAVALVPGNGLERCDAGGCEVVFAPPVAGRSALLRDGTWVYVSEFVEDVVAVWREGKPRTLYRIENVDALGYFQAVVELDDGLWMIGQTGVVELP